MPGINQPGPSAGSGTAPMSGVSIMQSKWQVEDAAPEHVPKILALFKEVFGQEMSEAHWDWKYGNGRGAGVIVHEDGDLIAYFGGMERRILFNGTPATAFQCGDSMVARKHRGTLSKKGPFFLSVASFLDRYLGHGRPYLISYGFPNERAMCLAERLGMYTQIGNLFEIYWAAEPSPQFHAVPFDFDDRAHRKALDELWHSMAEQFSGRAIGVRDLEYLSYRYRDHPSHAYLIHLVSDRSAKRVIGIVIARKTENRLILVDFLGRQQEFRDLVRYAKRLASEQDCPEMFGWMTDLDCHLISGTGENREKLPLRLPLGVYREGLDPEEIRDRWFFMCGDSDFM
ncbi:MAG: hypothetical protein CMQ45_02730 [Gammaproteobacteria bacterium]|nr:hypothetical protein [Gammaproteobacteria bacterium]